MRIKSDTQDTYMPAPGEVEEAECGVCGATMIAHRDRCGPTNFVAAISGSKREHDYFECPHRKEDWHQKVIDIRLFMRKVPSDVLCDLMRVEVDQLLESAWKEAKGVSVDNQMWLLPRMQDVADEIQMTWTEQWSFPASAAQAGVSRACDAVSPRPQSR